MSSLLVRVNNQDIKVKEFNRQRVITFKEIDLLNERPDGTARRNLNERVIARCNMLVQYLNKQDT